MYDRTEQVVPVSASAILVFLEKDVRSARAPAKLVQGQVNVMSTHPQGPIHASASLASIYRGQNVTVVVAKKSANQPFWL